MKRTISVILALIMLLNPLVFAIQLDVAEEAVDLSVELAAEAEVEAEAELAAGQTVPESVALEDSTYGTLIYYEDHEDGTTDNGYTIGTTAYYYGSGSTISVAGDETNRYCVGNYPVTLELHNLGIETAEVTFMFDVKLADGVAIDSTALNNSIAIWGDCFNAWPAISLKNSSGKVSADSWSTVTYTCSRNS